MSYIRFTLIIGIPLNVMCGVLFENVGNNKVCGNTDAALLFETNSYLF